MRQNTLQQKYLTNLVNLQLHLNVALPHCTDTETVYKTVRRYYQDKSNKPSKLSMHSSAELHVAEVHRERQQRLTYKQINRHTTI
jgi:hypothetical protein